VALFGTTGEGASFSVDERLEALNEIVSLGMAPKKIILANGSSSLPDTVELARGVRKHGCAAFLVAPPCFFKGVKEEGVIAFYREVILRSSDSNLKILLYHFPHFTGVPITMNIIEALLMEFPEIIVGVKESEGNLAFTKEILRRFPKLAVYPGNERQIIEAYRHGAAGSICGLANLFPELICSLLQNIGQNPPELDRFFEAFKGLPFIEAFKSVMEKCEGDLWHRLRPPLLPLNGIEKGRFLQIVEELPIRCHTKF
jgi:4-hydroxy-tetrahydrodipicolinate synthase